MRSPEHLGEEEVRESLLSPMIRVDTGDLSIGRYRGRASASAVRLERIGSARSGSRSFETRERNVTLYWRPRP